MLVDISLSFPMSSHAVFSRESHLSGLGTNSLATFALCKYFLSKIDHRANYQGTKWPVSHCDKSTFLVGKSWSVEIHCGKSGELILIYGAYNMHDQVQNISTWDKTIICRCHDYDMSSLCHHRACLVNSDLYKDGWAAIKLKCTI